MTISIHTAELLKFVSAESDIRKNSAEMLDMIMPTASYAERKQFLDFILGAIDFDEIKMLQAKELQTTFTENEIQELVQVVRKGSLVDRYFEYHRQMLKKIATYTQTAIDNALEKAKG